MVSVSVMFVLLILFITGFYWIPIYRIDPSNWSFIGLTLILINVMIWQTWRGSWDLMILPIALKMKKDGEFIEPLPRTQRNLWSELRLLTFDCFQFLESHNRFDLSFDIGNKGSQDVTVHEYHIDIDYPQEQAGRSFVDPQPIYETEITAKFNSLEYKYTEQQPKPIIHLERRRTLRPGERITRSLPISLTLMDDKLLVLNVELYTTKKEKQRWWIFYKKLTHVYCCDVGWKNGINYQYLTEKLGQKVPLWKKG